MNEAFTPSADGTNMLRRVIGELVDRKGGQRLHCFHEPPTALEEMRASIYDQKHGP